MVCPLLTAAVLQGLGEAGYRSTWCKEADCAWWQVDKCIIVTIANTLAGIANQMPEPVPVWLAWRVK